MDKERKRLASTENMRRTTVNKVLISKYFYKFTINTNRESPNSMSGFSTRNRNHIFHSKTINYETCIPIHRPTDAG